MSIRIYYDDIGYRFRGWRKTVKLLEKVIRNEKLISGDLNFIVTNDSILREMNAEFLNHDYNTDVIAFDYRSGIVVNGEIYISIDTVKSNSDNYNVSLKKEVLRVMIHAVLHLAGYRDKSTEEKKSMRKKEDHWLNEYFG